MKLPKEALETKYDNVADFMRRTPYRFYSVQILAKRTGLSIATVRRQLAKLDAECQVNNELTLGLFGRTVRRWYWCGEGSDYSGKDAS